MALHPVPTTATRLPARSTSWRHSAVWNAGPSKLSAPGMGGKDGIESWPQAVIRISASWVPPLVSSTHVARSSSQLARVTSVLVRKLSNTPWRRATSSR